MLSEKLRDLHNTLFSLNIQEPLRGDSKIAAIVRRSRSNDAVSCAYTPYTT